MDPEIALLRHFLAALAYRTQKAVRGAPDAFAEFRVVPGVRTPRQLVQHMTSVLGYARTFLVGGTYAADALPTLAEEVSRFHEMLEDISARLASGETFAEVTSAEILQGPFADAMTHAGQLALLRRLAGSPIPAENFLRADIRPDNVGADQPAPRSPGRRDGNWNPRGVNDGD